MNKPVETFGPDPKIMDRIDEILRQNALILEMNQDLLKMIVHPMLTIDPSTFRIDLDKIKEASRKGAQ